MTATRAGPMTSAAAIRLRITALIRFIAALPHGTESAGAQYIKDANSINLTLVSNG